MSISNQELEDGLQSFDHIESEESDEVLKAEEETNYHVFDQVKCRIAMAKMIIIDELPLSIVNSIPFRLFTRSVQPLLQFPSIKEVKRDIIQIHDDERARVERMLQTNESRVAISTNTWACPDQWNYYMMVTAHFIDSNWKLQSRVLRFVLLLDPHRENKLGDVLLRTLLDWDLGNKVSTITGDNCCTSDGIPEYVVGKLHKKSLIMSGEFVKMRCCANIINSIVEHGMDLINDSFKNVRESCDYWIETTDRIERFVETGLQVGLSMSTDIVSDRPHYWNSTYSMLKSALLYKLVFNQCSLLDNEYKTNPSDTDWDLANDICQRLESICSITKLFFETKHPTAFSYFQMVCDIKMALNDWLVCSNEVVQNMAAIMMTKFEEGFHQMHIWMGVVAVLDPRTKLHLVEFSFSKLFPSDFDQKVKRVVQICNDLVKEYQTRESLHTSSSSNPDSAYLNARYQISPEFEMFLQERIKMTKVKSELDDYLEDGLESRTADFSILGYWNANFKYPTLKAIARDLLAMSVSRVVYKSDLRNGDMISTFSDGNRILAEDRSKLDEKTLEAIMCSRSWLSESGNMGDISREIGVEEMERDEDYDEEMDEDYED